jgi:RND family efflux transporter MFP subunit
MSPTPPDLDGLRIKRDDRPGRSVGPWLLAGAVLVVIVVLGSILWYRRARPVEVRVVAARELPTGDSVVLNASGYVTARREATVSSKVTGKVDEILIEEGMKVSSGQVLARIDSTNLQANLKLARAQADAALAAMSETRVRLREAEQEFRRQSELRGRQVAAESDFDHAEAAFKAAQARLEQQQAEAAVAERTVEVWRQQLDDTVIRAPFGGTVTSKNAQPGEMISPMSTGGFTRTGICTIVDMESLEIEIDVNESYINRVATNQPVEATLDAYPEWRIPCRVIAIIPTADRNKSTVRVRVGFDKLDPRILPDMSVKVSFRDAGAANAKRRGVLVPRTAVIKQGEQSLVMVARDRHAERRAVVAEPYDADSALVTAGIAAGERVVVSPGPKLSEGTRIQEVNP